MFDQLKMVKGIEGADEYVMFDNTNKVLRVFKEVRKVEHTDVMVNAAEIVRTIVNFRREGGSTRNLVGTLMFQAGFHGVSMFGQQGVIDGVTHFLETPIDELRDKRIQSIKALRGITGLGLADAKDVIEALVIQGDL